MNALQTVTNRYNSLQTAADPLGAIEAPTDCYTHHVRTFTRYMREKALTDPLRAVTEYFADLNRSKYAAGTIRMKRQAVKNRLRMLADSQQLDMQQHYQFERVMNKLDTDPNTKAPKTNGNRVGSSKVITEQEYNTLILKARSKRQTLFMRFLWQTGCRINELTTAERRNCKREGKTVAIRVMGKGRKERIVKITAELYDTIRDTFRGEVYLFETGNGRPYFNSYISNQIGKLTKHVLGRRCAAHCFRHSFASRHIERTKKISAVSHYLGHSSVSTTLSMYNHEELSDADLFGAEAIA